MRNLDVILQLCFRDEDVVIIHQRKKIIKKHNLILIEDACESLGASYNKKKLGTIGKFGTYSFYYSHQITSGEGGMVVCDDLHDYNILKSLMLHLIFI